jgi:hypothetical protein
MRSSAHLRHNAKTAFLPDIANRYITACIPFVWRAAQHLDTWKSLVAL